MSICTVNPSLVFKIHPSEDSKSTLSILFTKVKSDIWVSTLLAPAEVKALSSSPTWELLGRNCYTSAH